MRSSAVQPVECACELISKQAEFAFDAIGAADHHMIGAWNAAAGQDFAGEGAEAALHAIPHDRAADLLGDGEADPHPQIAILAVADEQHESGRARAQPGVGGKEVRAFLDRS